LWIGVRDSKFHPARPEGVTRDHHHLLDAQPQHPSISRSGFFISYTSDALDLSVSASLIATDSVEIGPQRLSPPNKGHLERVMAMSTTTSNTHLKQIKASPAERINGKVKAQSKQDSNSNGVGNIVSNGTAAKVTNNGTDGLSPEQQRRRVSGRPQMTSEEQKMALRKRVRML
jgi:hypothetical protein